MNFSPLELFLLLVATIGPLKPTVILASAASSSGADPAEVRSVALRAALTASSILIAFIVLGEFALDMFKVSVPAFQIGGAIVLLIFALQTIIEDGPAGRSRDRAHVRRAEQLGRRFDRGTEGVRRLAAAA